MTTTTPLAGTIACLYGRRSKDEGQEHSLLTQDSWNLAACKEHAWPVGHRIEDDGISRAEFKKRLGLNRVLALAREQKFGVLVVYMSSRLGGDMFRTLAFLEELHELGVAVYYARDKKFVQLDSPDDKMIASFTGYVDERERADIVKKTIDGLQTKVRLGQAVQPAPYGYAAEPIPGALNKKGQPCSRWVIDEAEANVVRHIFDRYAAGVGLLKIAQELNSRGVKPPMRSGSQSASGWSRQTVRGLLTRTRYIGYMTHGAEEKLYRGGTRIRQKRAEADVLRVETPVVVSPEVWSQVQLRLTGNPRYGNAIVKRGRKPKYLLVGIAKCATCGGPIYGRGRTKKRRPVYICGKYRDQGKTVCANGLLVETRLLEQQVITALQAMFTEKFSARVFAGLRAALEAEVTSQPSQRSEQEKQATQLRKELGRLRKALIATDDAEELLEDFNARKRELTAIEHELAVAPAAHELSLRNLDALEQRARENFSRLHEASPEDVRALLQTYVDGKLSISKTQISGLLGDGLLSDPESALPRSRRVPFGIKFTCKLVA